MSDTEAQGGRMLTAEEVEQAFKWLGVIHSESVEFCTSGGRSPRTLQALRGLMSAIQADNRERPIS